MEQEGLWAGVGWERAERQFFRRLFWGYIWGIHRILMIPQTELPLFIYRNFSKGAYWLVSSLPARCHLFPLSKEFASLSLLLTLKPYKCVSIFGYCRVTSVSVRVMIRSAPLLLYRRQIFFFFFWSPRGEVR